MIRIGEGESVADAVRLLRRAGMGAYMTKDYDGMREFQRKFIAADQALRRIAEQQPRVLGYIRREGFVFDGNLADYEGWKKLAFSIYTDLCEVDAIARSAINGDHEDVDPTPADPTDAGVDRVEAASHAEAARRRDAGRGDPGGVDRSSGVAGVEDDAVPDRAEPMTCPTCGLTYWKNLCRDPYHTMIPRPSGHE